MEIEKLKKLVGKIGENGNYSYLFIDLSKNFNAQAVEILKMADIAIFVRKDSKLNLTYDKCLQCFLKLRENQDNIFVRNFDKGSMDVQLIENEKYLSVCYEPKAFISMGGFVKIDLNSSYGIDLAHIAKKIVGANYA